MIVSIFGLGYVGSVSLGCFASMGHEVIGVDINPVKLQIISDNKSPMIEAKLNDLITEGTKAGKISVTQNTNEAVLNSDVSLICVGTPSLSNGNINLEYVERVCEEIGKAIAKKRSFHVVAVRSTMLPGSIEDTVIPALERTSGLVAGKDFGVTFNPEFLREGTAVDDFFNPPYTLIGQYDERSAKILGELYKGIDAPIEIIPVRAAEAVKYANNAFHALKVVFANEVGHFCKALGIDSHQVMDIFCMDDKLNLSSYYLKPGFAFGGSCLPKDLRALLHKSRHMDLTLPVLEAILPSNIQQIQLGFKLIEKSNKKKVGILGFSFKEGTDDLRESPLVALIEMLIGKGYSVKIYDRNVSLARLHGANREFIETVIPHISSLMADTIDDVLESSEVIVIGNRSPEFSKILDTEKGNYTVIDLVRIKKDLNIISQQYEGIGW